MRACSWACAGQLRKLGADALACHAAAATGGAHPLPLLLKLAGLRLQSEHRPVCLVNFQPARTSCWGTPPARQPSSWVVLDGRQAAVPAAAAAAAAATAAAGEPRGDRLFSSAPCRQKTRTQAQLSRKLGYGERALTPGHLPGFFADQLPHFQSLKKRSAQQKFQQAMRGTRVCCSRTGLHPRKKSELEACVTLSASPCTTGCVTFQAAGSRSVVVGGSISVPFLW